MITITSFFVSAPTDYEHIYAAKQPVVVGGSSGKAAGGKGASVEQKVGERLPSDAVSTTDSYYTHKFC